MIWKFDMNRENKSVEYLFSSKLVKMFNNLKNFKTYFDILVD